MSSKIQQFIHKHKSSQGHTEHTPATPLQQDLSHNVQGDVIFGLHKRVEAFVFFSIQDPSAFRSLLKEKVLPHVTTTKDIQDADTRIHEARSKVGRVWLPLDQFNIAFSAVGLTKLGIDLATDFSTATAFVAGQEADAPVNLKDTVDSNSKLVNWKDPFLGKKTDGVMLFTSAHQYDLDARVKEMEAILGHSVKILYRLDGKVRPGAEEGHEHFGYADGISVPTLIGFNNANRPPGESAVDPNVILTGQGVTPSTWIKDGSFLVVRELQQLVPEFQEFVDGVALGFQPTNPGVTSDAIGARIVGRWKSGAPVVLSPTKDDPILGKDPQRNHNFDFSNDLDQQACPYAAHIRKTAPRNGTAPANIPVDIHHIIRQGIPFGHEVDAQEKQQHKTSHERGLAFACYQSSIENGFQFLQNLWANNPAFPFGNTANITTPGFDLLIGQADGAARTTQGIRPNDANDTNNTISAPSNFVVPRGGEYFFVPSIDALKNKLGA